MHLWDDFRGGGTKYLGGNWGFNACVKSYELFIKKNIDVFHIMKTYIMLYASHAPLACMQFAGWG